MNKHFFVTHSVQKIFSKKNVYKKYSHRDIANIANTAYVFYEDLAFRNNLN